MFRLLHSVSTARISRQFRWVIWYGSSVLFWVREAVLILIQTCS